MDNRIPLNLNEIAILTAAKRLPRRDAILVKAKELLEGDPSLDDRTLAFFFSKLVDTGLLARVGDEFMVTRKAGQAVALNVKVMSKVQNAATFELAF